MSRINFNVNSLIAQRTLANNNKQLTKTLERLATGSRINRGGDDPAGLIASEKLRAEKSAISSALANAQRAEQVVNIAEGGLAEVSSLLLELQSLVGQTASDAAFSDEEKEATQVQIDNILSAIDRIASVTSFQGTKLLNGNFDFQIANVNTNVTDIQVLEAKVPTDDKITVNAIVTQSAQHAGLHLSLGGTLDLAANSSTFSFEVAGVKGTQLFSFGSGTTVDDIAQSINNFKDVTGVSAAVNGGGITLKSTEYGSSQFVSVKVRDTGGIVSGDGIHYLSATDENEINTDVAASFAAAAQAAIRDEGQDVGAVINGVKARGNGRSVSINTDTLAVSFTLSGSLFNTPGNVAAFEITGGGAKFSIGTEVNLANEVALGLPNVSARHLGNNTVGFLDSLRSGAENNVIDGSITQAQKVVKTAIDQVTALRGRLGSFQSRVIGSAINSLNVALENVGAAESAVRDTDFAAETASLTRNQILVAAATNALAIANSQPQNVLALLG